MGLRRRPDDGAARPAPGAGRARRAGRAAVHGGAGEGQTDCQGVGGAVPGDRARGRELLSQPSAEQLDALVGAAREARERAYAPYSRFNVGAALLAEDDRVVTGANVENASYGLSMCAERTAVHTAASQGLRSFRAIAVVSGNDRPTWPCGACRQVLF